MHREKVTEKFLPKRKTMKKIVLLLSIMALSAECFAQLLEPLCIESIVAGPLNPMGPASTLTVTWKGGTAPFTVKFAVGAATIATFPNAVSPVTLTKAASDTYTVSVTDSSSAQQTVSGQATVGQMGDSLALSVAETDATCAESNGSVTASALSSNPNDKFTFTLTSTIPGFQMQTNNSGSFPDLAVGTYTVAAYRYCFRV